MGRLVSIIIHQTFFEIFPPSSIPPELIVLLTVMDFIHRGLVPEAVVKPIMEDFKIDATKEVNKVKALKTLKVNAAYGTQMFPDEINSLAVISGSRLGS
jgi:hypothetical protein